jgi:hypothetical protein
MLSARSKFRIGVPSSKAKRILTVPEMMSPVIEVMRDGAPLLQVWLDGRIAWSDDIVRGGLPLRTASIEPAAVIGAIEAIRNSVLLGGRWIGEVRTGPDADLTTVQVRDGETLIVDVGSWHEGFEADPRLVVTATGVEPLTGRSREAVLAQQPANYRLFRRRWDEVLSRLRGLIPKV